MKKLTIFLMLSALMAGMCFVSCDGNSGNSVNSENPVSSENSEIVTEEVPEVNTKPDMSEDEAIAYAKSAVEEKLYAIPSSEFPKSAVPGVAFNKFGSPLYDKTDISYDESENSYLVKVKGNLKANYAVNGVGLVVNDVEVVFSADVKVMVRTGDVSFQKPLDYSIVGEA